VPKTNILKYNKILGFGVALYKETEKNAVLPMLLRAKNAARNVKLIRIQNA